METEDSKQPEREELSLQESGHPFYPRHLFHQIIILYVLIAVILTLAILHPFRAGEPADPLVRPGGIKPQWYFLPMYQAIEYVPEFVGTLGSGVAIAVILLWPFLDGYLTRKFRRPRFHKALGYVIVTLLLLMGILGHLSHETVSVFGKHVHFDLKGVPSIVTPEPTPESAPAPSPVGEAGSSEEESA